MTRARRAFAAIVTVTAFAWQTAGARDSQQPFPRPAELEPAVRFWTRVYTEITTREGFIHDDLRLDLVYQTVEAPDDVSPRERRRRIERATETYRAILMKLAGDARSDLNAEERRVLGLFPEGTTNAELHAAAQRLRFQLGQSDRFRAGLIRSGTYKPYITDVLVRQGLPRELAVLPHVESSFDPTAYSKAGAAGMWQFMRSTGVRYMRIDHIIDERRDPFLATEAAARLLADNYNVLQSWPLALTAYNHGVAGMRRATIQQQTTDIVTIVRGFQSRSFGFASRNFYTAFLAALQIDSDPQRYFPGIRLNPPSDTGVVIVPDFMTADTLAGVLKLSRSALRELNPALLDTIWAGDKLVPKGFELRLPRVTAAVAGDLLAGVDTAQRYAAERPDLQHRVRRGDTLSQIAAEYHVSLAALMRANGLSGRDVIRVGQVISLPVDARENVTAAAEPAAVLAANTEPAGDATVAFATTRRAVSGEETVSGIATDELEAALAPAVLESGEPAPVGGDEAVATLESPDINALASVQAELAADPSDYAVSAANQVQVQALETLGHYAHWLKIPTQRLRDLNRLSFRESVTIGQMLTLDFARVDVPTFEQRRVAFHQQQQGEFFAAYQIEDVESHVIKSGESIWVLAARTYKVPVWLLRQYNPDLNLDRIKPGTTVRFPRLKRAVGGQEAAAPAAGRAAAAVRPATIPASKSSRHLYTDPLQRGGTQRGAISISGRRMPSPLEKLSGPGKALIAEPPDERELAQPGLRSAPARDRAPRAASAHCPA